MPEEVPLINGEVTTEWSAWLECPTGYAICGIRSVAFITHQDIFILLIIRKRLNGGTVPPFKMHSGGTVPPFKMHPGGTVPPFKMHPGGTLNFYDIFFFNLDCLAKIKDCL